MRFLVNLMFRRLDKLDGPVFGRAYIQGWGWGWGGAAYIRDVICFTYLRDVYSGSGLYRGRRINGILQYVKSLFTNIQKQ